MFGVHVFGGPYFGQGPPGIAEPPPEITYAVDVQLELAAAGADVFVNQASAAVEVSCRQVSTTTDVQVK